MALNAPGTPGPAALRLSPALKYRPRSCRREPSPQGLGKPGIPTRTQGSQAESWCLMGGTSILPSPLPQSFPQLPQPASCTPALLSPWLETAGRMDNALALPSLSMLNHTQPGSQRCHLVSNAQDHLCQAGAAWHAPCHRGEYQPSLASDTFLLCPPGFHCPHPSTRLPRLCPVHAYCPGGMPRSFQLPCLPGAVLSPQYPISLSLIHSDKLPGRLTACQALHLPWDHPCTERSPCPCPRPPSSPRHCCFSSLQPLTCFG